MSDETLAQIEQHLANIEARLGVIEPVIHDMRRLIGPWAATLADGRLMVHTLHSQLLFVDSTDLVMTPQLVCYRQWEVELTDLLWNSLRPETVFVDVGANLGYFTTLAGLRIHAGGAGRVIAIEPNPECCALLERNLILNWSMCDIDVHKVAVGPEKGEVWLAMPKDRSANAHLSLHGETAGERNFRVPMETLDSLVPEGLAVDVLKVDVEGHELQVFRGARRTLAQSPDIRIIMEWDRNQMRTAGVAVETLIDELKSHNLVARWLPTSKSLYEMDWENASLIPFETLADLGYENILLTKP